MLGRLHRAPDVLATDGGAQAPPSGKESDQTRRNVAFMGRRSLVAALFFCVLALALGGGPPADADPLGHVRWIHDDGEAWFTESDVAAVNDDVVPDVIVAGGDRLVYGWVIFPPGNPRGLFDQALAEASTATPRIVALDGGDGSVIWRRDFGTGDGLETKDKVELLDGAGLVDEGRYAVLRSSYDAQGGRSTRLVQRLALYATNDGHKLWESRTVQPADTYIWRSLELLRVAGRDMALVTSQRFDDRVTSSEELVEITSSGPRLVWKSGWHPGTGFATARAAEDEGVVYASSIRWIPQGDNVYAVKPGTLRAVSVMADGTARTLWSERKAGGWPMAIMDGPRPTLVVGDDAIVARDSVTGRVLWRDDLNLNWLDGGALLPLDVNGGGDELFAASPYGTDLYGRDFTTEFALIDSEGGEIWRHLEATGKYGPVAFAPADVDGDSTPEIVASMMHQDGFPFVGQYGDDPGLVGVYDVDDGVVRCRFSTDRVAFSFGAADTDGVPGDEVTVPTVAGRVYQFTNAEPGCGALATLP